MALGFDGSIRINTQIDGSGIERGIADINRRFDSLNRTLGNSLSKMNRGMTAASRGIAGLTNSLKGIARLAALAFGVGSLINFGREAVKASSDLSNAFMGLNSILEGQGKSFKKAKGFIDEYISDGLVPMENAVTAYKNLASRGYNTEQIEQVLGRLKDAAAFGRQSSYSLGEAIATATEGLKNENSILVKFISPATRRLVAA